MSQLTQEFIDSEIRPLFSRVLQRDEIYLANHSLGRPLDSMENDVQEFLDLWYHEMDSAWNAWLSKMTEFQSCVSHLLGWQREDCIISKPSAGAGLRAVLSALPSKKVKTPYNIVTTSLEFDSIDFILRASQDQKIAHVNFVQPSGSESGVPLFTGDEILSQINRDTDLVVISVINFTTGQIMPKLNEIFQKCKENQAWLVLDAYHAFGVIPLNNIKADFVLGGSYKYVHGGPGACWLAVHPSIADNPNINPLDTGWFAKKDSFSYLRTEHAEFAEGGRGWWESTMPIIAIYQALGGLKFISEIGIENIRHDLLKKQSLLQKIAKEHSVPFFNPSKPENFGAFSLLPHNNHNHVVEKLKENRVNVDSRSGYVRFGPDLLTTENELSQAIKTTKLVLATL